MKAIIFTIIIAFNVIGALRLKEKQISIRTEEEGKEEQEAVECHIRLPDCCPAAIVGGRTVECGRCPVPADNGPCDGTDKAR